MWDLLQWSCAALTFSLRICSFLIDILILINVRISRLRIWGHTLFCSWVLHWLLLYWGIKVIIFFYLFDAFLNWGFIFEGRPWRLAREEWTSTRWVLTLRTHACIELMIIIWLARSMVTSRTSLSLHKLNALHR